MKKASYNKDKEIIIQLFKEQQAQIANLQKIAMLLVAHIEENKTNKPPFKVGFIKD